MRRFILIVVLGALGHGALSGSPGYAQIVETPPGAVSSAQVSLAMDNDWQFLDAECLLIPLLATYGRADNTSIIGEVTVSKLGDPGVSNDATFLVLPGDPVSGQLLDEAFVCPADGAGEYRLSTLIRAIEPTAEQSFSLDPLTFWVRPATSRFEELVASHVKGGTRVSGVVRAGTAEATGIVEIRIKRPGSSRWNLVERAPIEGGSFSAMIERTLPERTRVRATLTGCSWCSRVASTTRVS